jgi:single-strand DNA-binding protein
MPNFNSATLLGNCVSKPELRHVPSGTAVCSITIAINHKYRDDAGNTKEDTAFVDVTLWGKLAQVCAQYVQIGDPVFYSGSAAHRDLG